MKDFLARMSFTSMFLAALMASFREWPAFAGFMASGFAFHFAWLYWKDQ